MLAARCQGGSMRRVWAFAAPFILFASLFFMPGIAHAVVNGTFTISGGNQQQVAQSTITLTNTATGQKIQASSSTNGNKKIFAFTLPDGNYTLTGTSGGQTFTQSFAASGDGAASGGFNLDAGALDPLHGSGVVTAGGGGAVNGGGARVAGGRRFDSATQSVVELGGGFGPLFNFENTRVNYSGSAVGNGGRFNESNLDVMPDFQLWANYRPAGWNGFYFGAAADVAIPTEGAQSQSFSTTIFGTPAFGMESVYPRDAMLTLQLRAGMRDPVLPGSFFAEGGMRIQDYRSTATSFEHALTGNAIFPIDNFSTDHVITSPTFGLGARVPLGRAFDMPALRRVDFDTEVNLTLGSGTYTMAGSDPLSSGTFQLRPSVSWLAKLEYEFDCVDP